MLPLFYIFQINFSLPNILLLHWEKAINIFLKVLKTGSAGFSSHVDSTRNWDITVCDQRMDTSCCGNPRIEIGVAITIEMNFVSHFIRS